MAAGDRRRRGPRARWPWLLLPAGAAITAALLLWWPSTDTPAPDETYDARLEGALHAVEARPRDPDAWMHLGEIYMSRSAGLDAEAAFKQALVLQPESAGLNARVGFLYYERGEDDLARVYLRRAYRLNRDEDGVGYTLALLEPTPRRAAGGEPPAAPAHRPDAGVISEPVISPDAEPPPAEPDLEDDPEDEAPEGMCTLDLAGGEGRPLSLLLSIEGAEVEFLLDTGATLTVITAELADRLRLTIDPNRVIKASTANGIAHMQVAIAEEVRIGSAVRRDVMMAVCEDCMHNLGDGLFGLDLQEGFEVDLDLGRRRLYFPCD